MINPVAARLLTPAPTNNKAASRGIGEGFGRARSALGDLNLLQDKIADNVDATWQAVQERLAAFFQPEDG